MAIDIQAQHAERELPSPSGVAQKVLQLLSQDDTTLSALAHALGADPVMAGRVIRLANSALYRGRSPVVAIADALQRVGLNALRQMLVAFSLVDQYRHGQCRQFDYQAFWAQSLATGVAARHLAELTGLPAPDECFTLGLLARVGELALATLHPEDYGAVHHALQGAAAGQIVELEVERFASDRFALAERLLRAWSLPESMALAARACGEPTKAGLLPRSAALRIARMLQVAVALGALFEADEGATAGPGLLRLKRLCEAARVPLDGLDAMLPGILLEWRDWAGALDLILQGTGPSTLAVPTPAEVIPFPRPPTENPPPEAPPPASRSVAIPPPEHASIATRPTPGGRDAPQRAPPPAHAPPLLALRVLLAHPDRQDCHAWLCLMRSQGHEVRLVESGDAALRSLLAEPPQIMLCDLRLRQIDALSLCRAARSSRQGREIYLMATAPRALAGALESAFGAGFDDFLASPVQAGELLARLRAARRFIELQERARADADEVRRLTTELALANARLAAGAETGPPSAPGTPTPVI